MFPPYFKTIAAIRKPTLMSGGTDWISTCCGVSRDPQIGSWLMRFWGTCLPRMSTGDRYQATERHAIRPGERLLPIGYPGLGFAA